VVGAYQVERGQKCPLSCINSNANHNRVEMIYYTYAYLREDKTPYYIGKGKGNRAYGRRYKGIKPPKDKSRILILKKNLTEEEAFRHEVYMIAVFGRKDLGTGILHNRTNGGEGPSGAVRSDEWKRKISQVNKCRIRKPHSEETKQKLSELNKGKTISEETKRKMSEVRKGKNNSNYVKKHSEETKIKISEAQRGRTYSEESKRKMSEMRKGDKHYLYGKSHSEETKRKMSEAHKGKTHSKESKIKMSEVRKGENNPMYGKKGDKNPMFGKTHNEETKKKLSELKIGKKWWNDGYGNCKMMIECPGDGWIPGRGKIKECE
jgi:hypothetical protein